MKEIIKKRTTDRRKPEGKIVENLGSMNAPGTDILAIVKSFNIPSEFPVKVMNQAIWILPLRLKNFVTDGRIHKEYTQRRRLRIR